MVYKSLQQEITGKIEKEAGASSWKNWQWQLKHSIVSLEQFEYLTGITFSIKEKKELI